MRDLGKPVREYVALRRALGYKLHTFEARLNEFVAFLKARRADYITAGARVESALALAVAWALESSQGRRNSAAARLRIVRGFAVHWSSSDSRTEIPPAGAIPRPAVAIRPYIFTGDEILRLMRAARRLLSPRKLRCHTYHCLVGLLAATGMRSGEAIRLRYDAGRHRNEDVDLSERLLTIRDTKFGKSRVVPIHATTAAALAAYAARRDTFLGNARVPTFFISERRRPLSESPLHAAFRAIGARVGSALCCAAGIANATTGRNPRMHDLRHRFAVHTLLGWYRRGADVERKLPVLSTFLGHGHIEDTYWYLSSTPELMGAASKRLEERWKGSL